MFVSDLTLIEEGVFLSGAEAAHHHRLHVQAGFGLVINCTNDVSFIQNRIPGVRYVRCRVNDNLRPREIAKMANALPSLVKEIRETRLRGSSVLVYCRMGIQRSACIIAAYIMQTRGVGWKCAVDIVRSARPSAFVPEVNFRGALESFQDYLAHGHQ